MARTTAATKSANNNMPSDTGKLPDKQTILQLFRKMLLIRRFEEKAGQLYGMGLIGGFCHLYIGQEAVVTGMAAVTTPKDSVITTYRDHGHMLACDMDPRGIMAELTGRIDGFSKGKGGSMHMFSVEKNFWGGHGIVGASVPLGTGIAFAHKYRGTNDINLCYFGDGASNQGQVYEAFNMAALWGLPILYIIENNEYAMGTSVKRSSAATELFRRGESLGIQGEQVNGMDVIEVMEKGKKAVERVRKGEPFILEMKTYRYRGHSMSDPAKYRTRDEVEDYREHRDPIEGLRKRALAAGICKEKDFEPIEEEIKKIVNDAAEFAKESPEPDVSELWTDVYTADSR
jgi:pyruvate dehydrogenase E1 component alpha subunit